MSRGNYSEKNVWEEVPWGREGVSEGALLSSGELFRGTYSGLVVFGEIIQG